MVVRKGHTHAHVIRIGFFQNPHNSNFKEVFCLQNTKRPAELDKLHNSEESTEQIRIEQGPL